MTDRKKSLIIYFLSFVVPVAVMTLCFIYEQAFPFGGNTVMTGDTTYQFVDYLSYLKTIWFGNNDFIYSLSKNLGGEMAGFAAYYYYSPLNLITLFFPSEYLPAGIFVILAVSPGLFSLSMCYCLGKIYRLEIKTLIFSYAYGLMAYVVVYNELFQYYTNLCLLPLIFLGLKRLIDERKTNLLYVAALSLAIINNYYTGYMICIFCVLYYIYRVLTDKKFLGSVWVFLFSSGCAGGISAFTLLPALMSLSGEKTALSVGFFSLFNPVNFFSKFYTGSFKGDFGTGLPNIYCGITVVLLFFVYFFNRRVTIREKILTALTILFFMVNFCINTFNVIWHGFNRPIGFPHRFAFLFVFFIIIQAYESLQYIEEADVLKAVVVSFAVFLLYSAYLVFTHNPNTGFGNIVISMIVLLISGCILIGRKRYYILFLIVIQVADLGVNTLLTLNSFSLTPMEEYLSAYKRSESLIEEIKEKDDGLYRLEKYFRRTHNDPFMHNYAGLSHFSSSEKLSTIHYMGRMGFRDNGNWAFYGEGNNAFTDSLFGVKYLLSQYGDTGKPYEKLYENKEGDSVFYNPFALPLLFSAYPDIYDIDYLSYEDPFALQEAVADKITGTKNYIFREIPVKKIYEDNKKCTFSFKTERDGIVEAYFTAPEQQNAHIFLNGMDYGQYFYTYRWNVLDLGVFEKGTEIEISFESPDGDDIKVENAYIYNEDFDALKSFYDKVTDRKTAIEKLTSSHFRGEAELDDSTELIFSVPYDRGWKAYVDGKAAKTGRAAGNLLGVSAGKGKHVVEFRYISPGQIAGYIVSLLSVIVFCVYFILSKRGKKIF